MKSTKVQNPRHLADAPANGITHIRACAMDRSLTHIRACATDRIDTDVCSHTESHLYSYDATCGNGQNETITFFLL